MQRPACLFAFGLSTGLLGVGKIARSLNERSTMKNLVFASILSSVATALAVPMLGGPVHFAVTRPYSMYGVLPYGPGSVTLGVAPLDFILTDVLLGSAAFASVTVTVNGTAVLSCGTEGLAQPNPMTYAHSVHLTSGVFIPAGSTVAVTGSGGGLYTGSVSTPVTVVGYVQ